MKYYVLILDRNKREFVDRRWLKAKTKKDALKEAQEIADYEFSFKNITVMLYKHGETDEFIKDFKEFEPFFL